MGIEKYIALWHFFERKYSAMPTFYEITFFLLELDLINRISERRKWFHVLSQSLVKIRLQLRKIIHKKRCAVLKKVKILALWHSDSALPKVLKRSARYFSLSLSLFLSLSLSLSLSL